MVDTAVLLLGYNRPEHTAQLMNRLAEIRPTKLYVGVDGPKNTPQDRDLVNEVRTLMSTPSWTAQVRTRLIPSNVGSRRAIEGALTWFFSLEPRGIVLEDDCIPAQDFFTLADHVLDCYEQNHQIWGMTGSNTASVQFDASYGFIRHPLTWGWATWADRWNKHQWSDDTYLTLTKSGHSVWPSTAHKHAFKRHLDSIAHWGIPDAWDYQWAWTVMQEQGLWIVPSSQLVENVGFAQNALNQHPAHFTGPPLGDLGKIKIPEQISVNPEVEQATLRTIYGVRSPIWLSALIGMAKSLKARAVRAVTKTSR